MIGTAIDLDKIAADYKKNTAKLTNRIIICAGTGCVANGSMKVFNKLKETVEAKGMEITVEVGDCEHTGIHLSKSGCQGFCQMGPLMTILPQNILYNVVREGDVEEIVEETLVKGNVVDRLLYKHLETGESCKGVEEIPFYSKQGRTILKQCGFVEPEDINEYIADEGYKAAKKAYTEMTPQDVCNEVSLSGLRGRGGGGFPTGFKWDRTLVEENEKKYVICNGDEGDPGAFMDRSLMEGNPHAVIEGMLIAARAVGANEGYVYVRLEYPLAVQRMKKAVKAAEELGLLGDNLFGTEFSFKLNIMEGAGAFVCGEETALISSIEGKRGMPTPKPPFPSQKGLFGKPTVINNVETLATVPLIIRNGGNEYKKVGTASSPGTKTFALTGHVPNTGLIEVPFGSTVREIVFNIGGGVTDNDGNIDNNNFKAVQIGGPSGGCLTEEHLDLPMDFDSLKTVGAMVGSGGLVVMNKQTCMVKIARFFMQFTQNESCGKCVPCREGTKQMLALLDDIIEKRATAETITQLERIAKTVQIGSLCGLGKTAPSPVISTLRYFRDEYEAHVFQEKCPAKECKAYVKPHIIPELCKGCSLCAKKCPVDAITGEIKKPWVIDEDKCINCGACIEACKFKAIVED